MNPTGAPLRFALFNLLSASLNRRFGIAQGSTRLILSHSFFTGFDVASLESGTMAPGLILPPVATHDGKPMLPPVKPFRGNQSIFADF